MVTSNTYCTYAILYILLIYVICASLWEFVFISSLRNECHFRVNDLLTAQLLVRLDKD